MSVASWRMPPPSRKYWVRSQFLSVRALRPKLVAAELPPANTPLRLAVVVQPTGFACASAAAGAKSSSAAGAAATAARTLVLIISTSHVTEVLRLGRDL